MTPFARSTAFRVLVAGALATVAFDLFGQGLSPFLGYPRLSLVPLAEQSLRAVFGDVPSGAPYGLHILTGLVAYPLGYLLLARPIARSVAPRLPWIGAAVAYGIILWASALYVLAHLVAGGPPFLGFTEITWVALGGHVLYAVVAAWVLERRRL